MERSIMFHALSAAFSIRNANLGHIERSKRVSLLLFYQVDLDDIR